MNILQIAEEEGAVLTVSLVDRYWKNDGGATFQKEALERFAARIRAEQKEKDAKICEAQSKVSAYSAGKSVQEHCADAIRNSK